MPKSKKSFLVDVNVWIAAVYGSHVHHAVARDWFETLGPESACFCRQTQLGFMRLLTNPRVMGADVMTPLGAWQAFDNLLQDVRVIFLSEPEHVDITFRQLTNKSRFGPNVWSDAYLGAIANAADLTVVTLDRAFANMPGVEALLLSER